MKRNFTVVLRSFSNKQNLKSGPSREGTALAERFEQILDHQLQHSSSSSFLDQDPRLQDLYNKSISTDHIFDHKYQKFKGFSESDSLLRWNKHARDISDPLSKPWDGNEQVADTNLRMIMDTKPPAKALPVRTKKKVTVFERLGNARDASLDYKIDKESAQANLEKRHFNMKEEKAEISSMFYNPSSPHIATGLINSIADAKVNANIDRSTGRFDDEGVETLRGKPLNASHLQNCTDSNYFMNQILNKHEVLPPWIESQQSIDRRIQKLQEYLDEKWLKYFISNIKPSLCSKSALDTKISRIKDDKWKYFRLDLEPSESRYIEEAVNSINSSVRDYNLQCPSVGIHKMKLIASQEIKDSFSRIVDSLNENIQLVFANDSPSIERPKYMSIYKINILKAFDDPSTKLKNPNGIYKVVQRKPEKIHFWKSFKEMFTI